LAIGQLGPKEGVFEMKSIVIASAAALLFSAPAMAAGNSDTQQGSATATVVAPITLQHTSGAAIGFGKFTTGTGGSVTVTPAGSGSVSGDVTFVSGNANTADAFTVAGEANRTFAISTTGGTVSNGAVSMSFATTASSATGTLNNAGAASFTVGGTLTVPGTATAGNYSGSYNATVTYN
jgi:hypothetical protein